MAAGLSPPTFLLLGAAGGGKSLLLRRLRPERRGARGAGRAPGHAAHGGHQPDGPAAAAEGDRAGAGRLHGPHLAQLLRRVQRSPVRRGCLQPHPGLLVLHPAALSPLCSAARLCAYPGALQQD